MAAVSASIANCSDMLQPRKLHKAQRATILGLLWSVVVLHISGLEMHAQTVLQYMTTASELLLDHDWYVSQGHLGPVHLY